MGRRGLFGFVLALGVALALAACGGSGARSNSSSGSNSADHILNASADAMAGAKTVRVSLSGKVDAAVIHAQIDLVSGSGMRATFTSPAGAFDLIVSRGAAYMRGNPAMWKLMTQTSVVGRQLGEKWVKVTAAGTSASGVGQLSRMTLAQVIGLLRHDHGRLTRGSPSTVNGRKVIALHSSTGGTLYVAAIGKPYLVKSVGGRIGTATYSDYGRPLAINLPRHAIDLDKLQQLGAGPSVAL